MGSANIDNITAVIKTFERPKKLDTLISSLRRFFPTIKIIVADDSKDPYPRDDVEYHILPYGAGLSAGRNFLVNKVTTKYLALFDDDFVCTKNTRLKEMAGIMERNPIDLVGGDAVHFGKTRKPTNTLLKIEDGILIQFVEKNRGFINGFPIYDKTPNFFVAKTVKIKEVMWDEELKIFREHEDFFLRAKGKLVITRLPKFSVDHFPGERLYGEEEERAVTASLIFNKKWGVKKVISVWKRPGPCPSSKTAKRSSCR
ncbi:glycosyltransferase [Candidatus Omnitrophota bacterium]